MSGLRIIVVVNNDIKAFFCKPHTSLSPNAPGPSYDQGHLADNRLIDDPALFFWFVLLDDLNLYDADRYFLFILVKNIRLQFDYLQFIDLFDHFGPDGKFVPDPYRQ